MRIRVIHHPICFLVDLNNRYVIEAERGQCSAIEQGMKKGEREGKREEARRGYSGP